MARKKKKGVWRKIGMFKWKHFPSRNAVVVVKDNTDKVWIVETEDDGVIGKRRTKAEAARFARSWMKNHPNG